MKFDTIIIGGGLSGLVCGIDLMLNGQQCVIISSGQSALHFSSGSFDLLNYLPDGQKVSNPITAINNLIEINPKHPYAKIGCIDFEKYARKAEVFFRNIGVSMEGCSAKNHFRITPMGNLKSTWLTASDFAVSDNIEKLPWKRVTIFSPEGFLDFYPQFIADEFLKKGTESNIEVFDLPDLDYLRHNPSEMRSTNISRVLDKEANLKKLADIINENSKDADAIMLPACIGLKEEAFKSLKEMVDKSLYLLPTLPPSAIGIRLQQYLHDYFVHLGGVYMLGDSIQKAEVTNNHIMKVYSHNHGDIPFIGQNFVLATGSYFSQGLIATSDKVYEPIFDLDVSFLSDRQQWYDVNAFAAQGYQQFGVKTDNLFRGLRGDKPINNLYVSGAILESFNPMKEGSGAGVSILTALNIVDNILNKK